MLQAESVGENTAHLGGVGNSVFHFITPLQTSWAAVQGLVLSGLLSCLPNPWGLLVLTPTETDTMAEAAQERGALTPTPVESGLGEGMLEWSLLVNNKTAHNYWAAIKSQTLLNPWD